MDEDPPFSKFADDEDAHDGCDIDYAEDPLSDDDLDNFILSPEGDEEKIEAYRALFTRDTSGE
jgi:hypothetical protein